jgi:RND superfamily putative drug exporter
MFQWLGHWVARYRFLVIAIWIIAAVVLTLLAPGLNEVSSSDQSDFLPEDAPFVHAQAGRRVGGRTQKEHKYP